MNEGLSVTVLLFINYLLNRAHAIQIATFHEHLQNDDVFPDVEF